MFARCLIAAAIAAAPLAAQAEAVMKLASATINDVQHEWQKVFAQELESRVGDRVKVEIYPASQLGPIPRMAEGVTLGTIEAFTTPTSFMTNIDPRFMAFDVPGLFTSPQDVRAVIHDPDFRDHMEEMFLAKGLRVIGAIYNSPTVVFTKEPVEGLAGLQGLKIRTFASPMQVKPMEAVGATPLPLALSEVVPALQSGALDGLLVGMPILTAFKFYDVGKHVTDLRFAEIVSVTVVNEAWFQSQPEEVREAIRAAGRAAEEAVFQWGVDNVERTYGIWRDNGGEIATLSDADQAKMQEEFSALAADLVAADPAVQAEYERIRGVLDASKGQ